MSASQNQRDEKQTPPDKSTVVLLLSTIGDTTWRMFVPIIIGLLVGTKADSLWQSQPWVAVIGLLIGVAVTTMLIRLQFRNIDKS